MSLTGAAELIRSANAVVTTRDSIFTKHPPPLYRRREDCSVRISDPDQTVSSRSSLCRVGCSGSVITWGVKRERDREGEGREGKGDRTAHCWPQPGKRSRLVIEMPNGLPVTDQDAHRNMAVAREVLGP